MIRWILSIVLLFWCGVAGATYCTESKLCWRFTDSDYNGGAGTTVADGSGNGNTGTFSSSGHPAWYNTSLPKTYMTRAIDATPNDQIISSGTILNTTDFQSGSITWWMNPDLAYNDNTIHGMWGQWTAASGEFTAQKYVDNNFYIGWASSGGGDDRVVVAASNSNYPQNTWSFYTLTWTNGGTSYLYLNGNSTPIGSKSNCTIFNNSAIFRYAGQSNVTFFNGKMAEMAIIPRVITSSEINDIKDNGLSPTTTTTRTIGWTIY
jgi:hypothetical protein